MSFQDNLRMYRERLDITAKEFATRIGISYAAYIGYESAGKEPRYDTLRKIATGLHVSIDDLLGYNQWLEKPKRSCPFCGGNDIEVYEHYGKAAGLEYGGFYPECTECGCRLNYYKSRKAAIDAWDRRFGE